MTAFDYKKEYKEFYLPPQKPQMIEIPSMNFLAVRGKGNPNEAEGDYKKSIGLLYGVAYTIKMSKMGSHKMDGYFDYVVPPLEGFWWQDGGGLQQEGRFSVDFPDPSAGICNKGGIRLGAAGSHGEKRNGLFQS